MQVVHSSLTNGSGLHRVAESLAVAESALGLESRLVDSRDASTWGDTSDADVFVVHSHLPPTMPRKRDARVVWVGHGTPDHCYQSSVEDAERGGYGHSDSAMLMLHWLKTADARVTFWGRHKWLYDQMLTRGARPTDLVPMGVDRAFWQQGATAGKFAGEPSLFYAENPHYIKWAYDFFTCIPTIAEAHKGMMAHLVYQVRDHHRVQFPWMHALGASFNSHVSPATYDKAWLRNAFQSCDYTVGLVRYGDLNHLSLEANAAGAKTISYAGNPHAMWWVPEGDQREIAKALIAILAGDVPPRDQTPVPDVTDMAQAFITIYEDIL